MKKQLRGIALILFGILLAIIGIVDDLLALSSKEKFRSIPGYKDADELLLHVDETADSNLMVHMGCVTNISLGDLATYDFDALPRYEYTGDML